MKKVAVVTATRAEYGLLMPVIRELRKRESEELKVSLAVTGTHLSEQYGLTVNEILNSGVRIDHRIPIPVDSKTEMDISSNQAETLIRFSRFFCDERFDAVILLGDRYETLAIAIAAGNTHTPIFHLCGGDTTEGALDEWIRHSITKMSYLHFVTNEESRKRVIQLGEGPDRVFNYGSTSIDNIMEHSDMSKEEALGSIGMHDCNYAVCTYHPVSMERCGVDKQMASFFDAVDLFPGVQFIITKSNSDLGGGRINELLDEAAESHVNMHVFTSLGVKRYLSLMKHAEFVLGNSSSGIIEAPAFHIPTVNIGDRQRGRLHTETIIDCGEETPSIAEAIRKAMEPEFRKKCLQAGNPYGDGHAGQKIAEKCIQTIMNGGIDLKKKFFDLKVI